MPFERLSVQTASPPFTTISLDQEQNLAIVTLRRPEVLNALNATMFDDLERAFLALAADKDVRAILLTGEGERAFAAGADIRGLLETDAADGERLSRRGQDVFSLIEQSRRPVIACVNGVALGGGCELAMACTLRFAADRARFGLPEVKLGLTPGYGGTQRLARLTGRGTALRLMLTAQIVDAAEALRIGLVDEVVPAHELMTRRRALAGAIAAMAPHAINGVLEAVSWADAASLEEALRSESAIFGRLCGTADKREGVTAFLEKRPPHWTGS